MLLLMVTLCTSVLTFNMLISKEHKYFIWIASTTLALLSAISPFAVDGMNPAIPTIAETLGVKLNQVEMLITSYLLGLTVGQLFGGPLSDSFGRKPIAIIGIIIYILASVAIPQTNSIDVIYLLRFIQAIGGGFSVVVNIAIIRDLFNDKDLAQAISLVGAIAMLAPLFAPVLGTIILTTWGWEAIFYGLAIIAAVIATVFYIILPESRDKALITKKISFKQALGSYKIFFSDRYATLIMFSISATAGGLFTYITVSPTIFMGFYGFDEITYTKIFLSLLTGNIILNISNIKLVKIYGASKMASIGLTIFVISSVALAVATTFGKPPFIYIYIPLLGYISSLALIYTNMVSLVMERFKSIAGAANAVIGVVRFLVGAIAGAIVSLLYNETLIPIGVGLSIFAIASALLFYFAVKRADTPN